jgi:hypothetical protein
MCIRWSIPKEFIFSLPDTSSRSSFALSFEPCTGPAGTNVVRSPDGVHFCPDGHTKIEGAYIVCDVYSSGAFRFAMAMLASALAD